MPRVCCLSLLLVLSTSLPAQAGDSGEVIDFPCLKNLGDGRVLVDGTQWDDAMRSLGHVLTDGAYVPYEVLSFKLKKKQDDTWAEGRCRMKLLPVAR